MTEKKREKEKITSSDKSERDLPLAVKIAKAANDMGPIAKDGNNKKQDFLFISESAIKAGVRKVCAKYGFTIFPKRIKEITRYERRTARGGTLYFYDVMQEFEVTDGKETITGEMMGTGSDTGDKAYNKAVTVALKNFEKQLFNVSDQSDDPDSITPPETTGTVSNNQQPYQGQYNNYQNYHPTPVPSKPRKLSKAQLENYTVEFSDGEKRTLKAIFKRAETNDVVRQWIKSGKHDNTTATYIKQLGSIYKAEKKIKAESNQQPQQPVSEDDDFEDIIAK
ncbi:ERF family protein [Lactobacillus taiwanensis]|uniref:ERF family protein n=1 Tax=Lactobacillus taiwanensis TaxID=508451 RepID=UPI0025A96770|nr:ERF family protein [Lactobacillus taiwanensis]